MAIGVWAAAFAALAAAAQVFRTPGFMDAYYYYHVAVNLAAGRGFTEDVVWNYLTNAVAVSHASNLYWMPLTSLFMAPVLALGGESFRLAQVPLLALSAAVPAITAVAAARRLGGRFRGAIAAGIALFCGYYFVYWTTLDSFGAFALAALAVFLLAGRLSQVAPRTPLLLGLGLGAATAVAHLARADGPQLAVAAWVSVVVTQRRCLGRSHALALAASLAAYLVCMGPWLLRNLAVSGALLPSGGVQTLWLTEYNEIFSYQLPLTFDRYLAQEIGPIVQGKLTAAVRNLGVLFGLEYWLIPFAVAGWWRLRHWGPMGPAFTYGVLLYLVMTLAFTFPSGRGSMLHSGVALVPWLAIAAVVGIEMAVHWVAKRLPHWNPPVAFRNFSLIFVALSAGLCVYLTFDQARDWHRQVDGYQAIAPAVPGAQPVVMTLNPPGWWYVTRQASIQVPSDGPAAAVAAADRYGATHLLLEPQRAKAWEQVTPADLRAFGFRLVTEAEGYSLFERFPIAH
ncbi:MAG: hypothetical protein EXR52_06940 [Dehalococcoidia bacterium]|nr:hypothetical protein [Dehalococcoidia bacterium]